MKLKVCYYSKTNPDVDIYGLKCGESEIESCVREFVQDGTNCTNTLYYHTYSSIAVNVFRLLVVEGIIPWDSIEFYTDDKQVVINKYANCLDYDIAKWGEVDYKISIKLIRTQQMKKKNDNKAIKA